MSLTQKISIEWHIEDILSVRPDLTELQASDVLEYLESEHDANMGINWEVIEAVCDMLFPE